MSDTHKRLCVKSSGLVINQDFPYTVGSPDDIRSCAYCMETMSGYKCPFTNRDEHPKESYLDKNVGGFCDPIGNFTLKKNHRYYFQV